jgi:hypothetical protein
VYREVAIVFVAAGPTKGPLSGLSYRAVKVARGVLRGLGASDGPWLPDQSDLEYEKFIIQIDRINRIDTGPHLRGYPRKWALSKVVKY